jgi:hypothetical protein
MGVDLVGAVAAALARGRVGGVILGQPRSCQLLAYALTRSRAPAKQLVHRQAFKLPETVVAVIDLALWDLAGRVTGRSATGGRCWSPTQRVKGLAPLACKIDKSTRACWRRCRSSVELIDELELRIGAVIRIGT